MIDGGRRDGRRVLDMNGYQWTVLLAAWLGWGFDVFDSVLFNQVAPNCVPTLLGIPLGTDEARAATLYWTGALTSIHLIGWAVGGIVFGKLADKVGRKRTLLITMGMFSLGTAACAFAPNIWALILVRSIASVGIGGEWAAGAAMVAEVVPEKRRVEAGALLFTAAPLGLFLATAVTYQIAGVYLADSPEKSWRYVFLFGLAPAAVAFAVRAYVKEPDRWRTAGAEAKPPSILELFSPEYRAITLSGLSMAIVALITMWTCSTFNPTIASGLAQAKAKLDGLDVPATLRLAEEWKKVGTNYWNLGGLLGTLLTVPLSKLFGRRPMFLVYLVGSAATILCTFGIDMSGEMRLVMYFPLGLTVFGVFGSFTYYLPELFPTRLRATGSGFCYNSGRVLAAAGPLLVGFVASRGADSLSTALTMLFYVGLVPLAGILLLPWVIETRGKELSD